MLKILLAFAHLLVARSAAQDVTTLGPLCTAGAGGQMLVRGATCYEFVDTEMTWVDARQHCRKNSGQLVGVPDADMQLWIAANAARLLPPTRQGMWIGLNDRQKEGHYVWDTATGQDQYATYFNWREGEPNDGGIGQDCVYMRRSYSWQWSDTGCNLKPFSEYSFICEYVRPTPSVGPKRDETIAIIKTVEMARPTVPITVTLSSSSAEENKDVRNQDESNEDTALGDGADAAAAHGEVDEERSPQQSVLWSVGGVLLVVAGGTFVFAFCFFSKRRGRFARLQIATSSATASNTAGDKGKKLASDSADDIQSSLLYSTYLADRFTAELQQQPVSIVRASPNIYVDAGFAYRSKAGSDGRVNSGDEPVYAKLVEPLP